jgi:uridylate kinase
VVQALARQIAAVVRRGMQVAVVVGGGNFFRGAELQERGMDRGRADYMGMLGTVMNCLALQDFLEKEGIDTRVQSAISMAQVAEPYIPRRAIRHLEKGRVVIFGAGAGMPYFTTDTVAAQRALEIRADIVLMSKNGVDGVYTADPRTDPTARKLDSVTFEEALRRGLKVVDAAAFSLCQENKLPMLVFGAEGEDTISRAVAGEKIGTLITPSQRRTRGADIPRSLSEWNLGYRERSAPKEATDHVIEETLFEAEERMERAIDFAKDEFAAIRTGRATPGMFARIVIDYYGAPTPLPQMATIAIPEPRMVIIKPHDPVADQGHGEGDPRLRPRGQPEQRRAPRSV